MVPLVKGVRDAATVERAHREGVEDDRAALRRLLPASDCARMRDWTLIPNRAKWERWKQSEGTTRTDVCWGSVWGAARKKSELSEVSIT